MVTCLSALTSLKTLIVEFDSPRSPSPESESRYPPSPTRILLPAVTCLKLTAINKYVEDFMTRIDIPLLDSLDITFFDQATFDTPHLSQFIVHQSHTQLPGTR
jgi:hypothetical protein